MPQQKIIEITISFYISLILKKVSVSIEISRKMCYNQIIRNVL